MFSTPSPTAQAFISTPLGELRFYTTHKGGVIDDVKLVQGELEPILPSGMRVSACVGVLLQFSVHSTPEEVIFHCDWSNFSKTGYGATGEGLDAWEWEYDQTLVVIGTEDADWLGCRIPLRPFAPEQYPITMDDNHIKISLHEPPKGNTYTLHFIVAWNPSPEPKECSCWYAVDLPHARVIKQLTAPAQDL